MQGQIALKFGHLRHLQEWGTTDLNGGVTKGRAKSGWLFASQLE